MKTVRSFTLALLRVHVLVLLFAATGLHAQAAKHFSCTPIAEDQPAPNAAVKLYWNWDIKGAAEKFKQLLAAQPNDPDLTEGSVRANIALGDLATAEAQAQSALAAQPDSAAANTAQAEVLYRSGKISEADHLFARATQLDPCFAPARLGIYHVARASSMYASAAAAIKLAHALNRRDPDIQWFWLQSLPLLDRMAAMTKIAAGQSPESEAGKHTAEWIAYAQQQIDNRGKHSCQLVSAIETTQIPMVPIMRDVTHVATMGIDTKINGKTARLDLDSGASGILVGRGFAEHIGLKPEQKMLMGGFGDHGPQHGFVGYADTIHIGNLEFHDCPVRVTERREVSGMDGLLGPDVFRNYLVSIDYPDSKLTLGPLPGRPGAHAATDSNLQTADDAALAESKGPQDRYIAPEMKDFAPIYRFGHDLLIPAIVNDVPIGLMMLDTGDQGMSLNYAAARKVTHARVDTLDNFSGLSGRVEKLSEGGDVTLKFGHGQVRVDDVLVMDHGGMQRGMVPEISGFIGYPALRALTFQIDYRDGLVNFLYDKKKDPNRRKTDVCTYCNPGYSPH